MSMRAFPRHRGPFIPFVALHFVLALAAARAGEPRPLFDGKSFEGWEGDTKQTWRIEHGALVAGSLDARVPRNDFLCTKQAFEHFELTLRYQLEGTEGFVNSGVQIRSNRVPDHHEMIGYQADIGAGYDGALYDESRRNRVLAKPTADLLAKAKPGADGWNTYRIRCQGNRIQLWLNDVQTVDYIEQEAGIATKGVIGLQIHGDGKTLVRFKDIRIEELAE